MLGDIATRLLEMEMEEKSEFVGTPESAVTVVGILLILLGLYVICKLGQFGFWLVFFAGVMGYYIAEEQVGVETSRFFHPACLFWSPWVACGLVVAYFFLNPIPSFQYGLGETERLFTPPTLAHHS